MNTNDYQSGYDAAWLACLQYVQDNAPGDALQAALWLSREIEEYRAEPDIIERIRDRLARARSQELTPE